MKLIVGKNDSGKTRELIKYSIDKDIPIFALDQRKAESLRSKALSYFGVPICVMTPDTLASNEYHGDILIDDMEKVFEALLGDFLRTSTLTVAGATITED